MLWLDPIPARVGPDRRGPRPRPGSQVRRRPHRPPLQRPRHLPPPDLLDERGSAEVLRSGLPDDVRLRAARRGALVPRVVEARSELRHLLLGRGLGVGLVPERADAGRAVALRVLRAAEGHQPEDVQATQVEKDFIDALAPRYVEKFDAKTRRQQDEAYAESMRTLAEKYPNDLDAVTLYGDALFLLEPRRGRRDVDAPNIKRLHGVLESRARQGQQASRRLPPLRARHRVHGAAASWPRPAPSSWAAASPAPATSSTCRRTRGTKSAAGRTRCARTSKPGTRT